MAAAAPDRTSRPGDRPGRRAVADWLPTGRVVVTGGAGFLGAHLCRALLDLGLDVVAVDSLITGRRAAIADLETRSGFAFVRADIIDGIRVDGPVDAVLHLASPASPVDYLRHPIHTLKVGSLGTHNALGLARALRARFLLASTSEVYGDPEVHPQPESYLGNVDPVGPRGVYDEAKRFAEAMATAYRRQHDLEVRIARIFNTYGPGMRHDDGRVVPTLLDQARRGVPLTLHGDGSQTRSLCFVDDLVEGLLLLLASDLEGPCNLGSDEEVSVRALAELVLELTGSDAPIEHLERPVDDPGRRRPDLTLARDVLGFSPQVPLRDGLRRTFAAEYAAAAPPAPGGRR